jgi:hypothetical protein
MNSRERNCPIDIEYNGPLEKHHINGRKIDKYDEPWNVVYISPNTHTLIHEGEIIIEGWFQTTQGRKLIFHRKDERSFTGRKANPHLIHRH